MGKSNRTGLWIVIAAAAVTLLGLLTGWYLFLFIWFPVGYFFKNKKNKEE